MYNNWVNRINRVKRDNKVMNIFRPVSCVNLKDEEFGGLQEEHEKPSYNGPIVILENIIWPTLFLFFPITKKNMDVINQALTGATEAKSLSIYKTMIDSWKGSDNYLSGIIMDLNYEPNSSEPKIVVNFALSSGEDGKLKSLVPVSFVDSIIISILCDQDYMVGARLLNLMLPDEKSLGKTNEKYHALSDDENIKDIVRHILEGKIQGNGEEDDFEDK